MDILLQEKVNFKIRIQTNYSAAKFKQENLGFHHEFLPFMDVLFWNLLNYYGAKKRTKKLLYNTQ